MKYRDPDTGEFVELSTPDHSSLTGRDADDQHPIDAVTGLQSALDGKADSSHSHNYADLPADVARTGYVDTGDAAAKQYADTQDDAHSTADRAFTTAGLATKADTGHNHDTQYDALGAAAAAEAAAKTHADTQDDTHSTADRAYTDAGLATKIGDAPSDGKPYLRQDAGWLEAVAGDPIGLDDLTDVDTSTAPPVGGQALVWDGSMWTPGDVEGGGGDFLPLSGGALTGNLSLPSFDSGIPPLTAESIVQSTSGTSGTRTVTLPAGIRDGDILVALMATGNGTSITISEIAPGFQRPLGFPAGVAVLGTYGSARMGGEWFWRYATAADSGTTVSFTSNDWNALSVVVLRGAKSPEEEPWEYLDGGSSPTMPAGTKSWALPGLMLSAAMDTGSTVPTSSWGVLLGARSHTYVSGAFYYDMVDAGPNPAVTFNMGETGALLVPGGSGTPVVVGSALDMQGNDIVGVQRLEVDQLAARDPQTGVQLVHPIYANGNPIYDLNDPVLDHQAANKGYVDAQVPQVPAPSDGFPSPVGEFNNPGTSEDVSRADHTHSGGAYLPLAGGSMQGDIDFGWSSGTNLWRLEVEELGGLPGSGVDVKLVNSVNADTNTIYNLPDPTTSDMAATKGYVDANGGGGGGIPADTRWVWATESLYSGIHRYDTLSAAETGTDSKAGLDAFFASVPDGGTAIIPSGFYNLKSQVMLPDKNITVQAEGAYFVLEFNGVGFRFAPAWPSHIDVTSIVQEQDTSLSKNGESLWYTKLTLASSADGVVTLGDVVKLFSNDLLTFVSGTVRSGESGTVAKVAGTEVWLSGRMKSPFTTNVRMVKFPSKALRWTGGTFERHKNNLDTTTDGASMIYLEGARYPEVVNVRVRKNGTSAITVRRCFGAIIRDCVIDYARNANASSGNESNGYGVIDSSQMTTVDNLKAYRVRHAYATGGGTNVTDPDADDDPLNYGAVIDARIINGFCQGSGQTAWDTHGDANGVVFTNCTAIDCYTGFVLRGINNRVENSYVRGSAWCGVHVNGDASDVNYIYGSVVSNTVFDSIQGPGIYFQAKSSDPHGEYVGGIEARPCYALNVTFVRYDEAAGSNNRISANKCKVLISDVHDDTGSTTYGQLNNGTVENLKPLVAEVLPYWRGVLSDKAMASAAAESEFSVGTTSGSSGITQSGGTFTFQESGTYAIGGTFTSTAGPTAEQRVLLTFKHAGRNHRFALGRSETFGAFTFMAQVTAGSTAQFLAYQNTGVSVTYQNVVVSIYKIGDL
jgi:hypothetical protein